MRSLLLKLEHRYTSMHSRDQKIFPYFTFVCIFLVFYFLIVSPVVDRTRTLEVENDQMRTEANNLKQKLQVLSSIQERKAREESRSEELKEQFSALSRQVPSRDEISGVLSHLAMSEEVAFLIQKIAEKDYVEQRKYTVIPVTVAAQADYDHIFSFLQSIEKSERLLTINGLQLAIDPENPVSISALFTVNAYKIQGLETLMSLYYQEQEEARNVKP